MSPFMKGALGFIGCAGVCAAAYAIGKSVGREETLKEIDMAEREERIEQAKAMSQQVVQENQETVEQEIISVPENEEQEVLPAIRPTTVEKLRRKRSLKSSFLGSFGVIKDLFRHPDNTKITITSDNGEACIRISPNKEEK